ncbi:hypothetical protein RAC89_04420 [Paenibacillus sp. GD4]|uniref:hypothetical protein n=1 Tax=Paenibacillus sp. GD4 TaxID=3068890 RepID=UPI002796B64B|nr:hypothetical protein [Paenibacillus sp. GD4]MDQ1909751.1 hypothetical protein [Paenibacillus sp. GD4]
MTDVMLRPDLKTAGGEVSDVLFKNRYVGTLTLVYREQGRISGSLQLEKEVLSEEDTEQVYDFVHLHVQALLHALGARDCEVMVTYSTFDHVIAAERHDEMLDEETLLAPDDADYDYDWVDNDNRYEDEPPASRDEYSMEYELVIVGESRNAVEYHVYDQEQNWVAEAFVRILGSDVTGAVHWMLEPEEEDIDTVTDLIVHDFDSEEIDTFVLDMIYDDKVLETIELTHEELLDEAEEEALFLLEPVDEVVLEDDLEEVDVLRAEIHAEDYSVVLARDDGDVLTYEIYQQSRGGLPIGTATVDISQKQLTGFIDFRDPGTTDDREYIATILMQELDKEKDYDTINLSMMHRNRLIEEMMFESEQVH